MVNNAKVKFITSESVAPGHPDKVCDQISDAVLDEVMRQDPLGRVACETYITMGLIIVGGEITTSGFVDIHCLVRDILKEIGYTHQKYGFDYHTCAILNAIHAQSPDIAQGVDKGGAGDQGMMVGYACQETPELMPLPITLCHKLIKRMVQVRKEGILDYLGPDGKSQVTIEYENDKPKRVENVVLACQHTDEILDETGEKITEKARKEMIDVIALPVLGDLIDERTKFFVNETGKFVIGGPQADTGMTGRKIIVDTYGGTVPHGGGAFCIHGDSLVSTEKGLLKIKDIKKEVENGLFVKTDTHPHRAKTWYDNGQRETIKIVTRSGYKIEGTPNQKIRIINKKGNYVWKRLDQLTKNDFVAIQLKDRLFGKQADVSNFKYIYKEGTAERRKNKFIYPKILTDDYAYLLGLLIGDGNCMDRGGIWICVFEKEQKDNIQNLYKRLFGRKGKIFGHWAFMGGVEMRAYLEYLGLEYKRSWEKEVPWSIFQAPKKVVAAFLRGFFDTDGSIRTHGRNKNFPDIKLYSTSQQLIKGVQQLLLNFGVVSQVGQVDATGKKFIIGKENRKAISRRKVYNLRIKNVEGVKIFKSELIFNLPRKRKILNKINLEHKRNHFIIPHQRNRIKNLWQYLTFAEHQKDKCNIGRFTRFISDKATKNLTYQKLKEFLNAHKKRFGTYKDFQYLQFLYKLYHFYDKVAKIKSSWSSTYDLYVPGVNTFIANGFVCHNSGKDPTKVDRSGAYMARYVAKNIVAAGLAEKCFIQIAYVIGVARPISIMVDTFGTGKIPEEKIIQAVKENFNLTPKGIIEVFDLRRPIFRQTARFGHFGREEFPWEKTDKVQILQKYF